MLLGDRASIGASPAPRPQPIPLCWGQAVPAWGIRLPFPAVRHAGASTRPAPSAGALKVSSSRCLQKREHRDAPVSTNLRGTATIPAQDQLGEIASLTAFLPSEGRRDRPLPCAKACATCIPTFEFDRSPNIGEHFDSFRTTVVRRPAMTSPVSCCLTDSTEPPTRARCLRHVPGGATGEVMAFRPDDCGRCRSLREPGDHSSGGGMKLHRQHETADGQAV